jgi:hypothetical protein
MSDAHKKHQENVKRFGEQVTDLARETFGGNSAVAVAALLGAAAAIAIRGGLSKEQVLRWFEFALKDTPHSTTRN